MMIEAVFFVSQALESPKLLNIFIYSRFVLFFLGFLINISFIWFYLGLQWSE